MALLSLIMRVLTAATIALCLVMPVQAGNDIIGLDGQPIASGLYGFDDAAEAKLLDLMKPIAPFVAAGAPNTTTINQVGTDLFAHAAVEGSSNLTLIQQSGSNNRAVQAVAGNQTALLLQQSGSNNSTLQLSVGNDNFQLLGVSGQNNDVAYIQAGNELAGALKVGGENASVLALQTDASHKYLMPVGLNGLKNQVVVIVPGRMYVFKK